MRNILEIIAFVILVAILTMQLYVLQKVSDENIKQVVRDALEGATIDINE